MKQLSIIVLILAGLYFLIDHKAPLPLNHEAIGLGINHIAHSAFGIILFIAAGYLWWRNKNNKGQVQ
jgi:glucose uptake protein GlcU